MSENKTSLSNGFPWLFMSNYAAEPKSGEESKEQPQDAVEPLFSMRDLQALLTKIVTQQEEIIKLNERLTKIEETVQPKLDEMDGKLEKLIQSNRNLIQYFSSTHDRDARELNYRIRGFSARNGRLPPVSFVPDRRAHPI